FPVLPLGSSEAVQVGEPVVAIGNPLGLSRIVTSGIVSFKGRTEVISDKRAYADYLQIDAAINPGNSDGPLLDARGQVIGVNSAVMADAHGLAFAIPIDMVKQIVPHLYEHGSVTRGWVGLSIQDELTPELAESFGVAPGSGVLVSGVSSGGPAERAGLRAG